MIEDYLKTSLPMYVTLEEQHYRSDCCKNRLFYLRTDTLRLPPFQIMTTNGGSIGGITLYDTDGNVVANAGITDLANNHLHEQTDCETYWYIYNGIVDLSDPLPLGDYYIVVNIIGDLGSELWYSEVFTVCDCHVVPVGDDIEKLLNGNFFNWTGDDPDDWIVSAEDANNFVTEDPAGGCRLVSNGNLIAISQDILTIGKYYAATIEINEITGTLAIQAPAVDVDFTTTGIKTIVFLADQIGFTIKRGGVCDAEFDNVSVQEFRTFEFCDDITVTWWNECDFEDIIYQLGYRNRLYFDEVLAAPREEITKDQDERLGENFELSIILKKFYQLRDHVPEYIYNMMIRWPLYDNVYITLPSGESAKMEDINITSEWQDKNCYNHITVEFTQGPLVKGQCCENFNIMDESSCS